MRIFFTNLVIWLSFAVGFLSLCDLLLKESQKKKIEGWGEYAYYWLDEQRLGKFINPLLSYRLQFVLCYISFLLVSILYLYEWTNFNVFGLRATITPQSHPYILTAGTILLLFFLTIFPAKIHPKIISWFTGRKSVKDFFLRSLAAIGILFIAFGCVLEVVYVGDCQVTEATINYKPPLSEHVGAGLIGSPILSEFITISMLLLFSTGWLALVLALMGIFKISQFIIGRIVEYPKGVILGLSALLLGISTIIKTFF